MSNIVYYLYKVAQTIYKLHIPMVPGLLQAIIRISFGCYLPYKAKIGKNVTLAYGGLGIVIHPRCEIGVNCYLGSGITIGGTSQKFKVPKIGDNVYVGTGAKILGPVTVGDNVVIGANSVVLNDVPSNSVVAGVPAKIIKENINIRDYM